MSHSTIALVGDRDDSVTAHRAIPIAIEMNASALGLNVDYQWLPTEAAESTDLTQFDGLWCVPASPYRSEIGAINSIAYARKNSVPFFGSCGGYQHAVLEYARNELQLTNANNTEVDPETAVPLIHALHCALVDVEGDIVLNPDSALASWYGTSQINEGYRCSYGVNPEYLSRFVASDLSFCGFDRQGDPRAFVHLNHPFFVGVAFQPERSALKGETHPLISQFLLAIQRNANTQFTLKDHP